MRGILHFDDLGVMPGKHADCVSPGLSGGNRVDCMADITNAERNHRMPPSRMIGIRLALLAVLASTSVLVSPLSETGESWLKFRNEAVARFDGLERAVKDGNGSARKEAKHEYKRRAPGIAFYFRQRMFGCSMREVTEGAAALARLDVKKLRATDGGPWSFIGPSNIAGRVRSLAIDPMNPNIIYAGAATGGVFKSTDAGLTWNSTMDQQPTLSIGALVCDAADPRIVYAGTGESTIPLSRAISAPVFQGIGVLRSMNGGGEWSQLPWPYPPSSVSRIALHPASSDTLLVATRNGLYKSVTAGSAWATSFNGVISDVRYRDSSPSTVFAAVGDDLGAPANGVYRSDAGGKNFSWKKCALNFPSGDSTGRILLASTPADPSLLYALVARPLASDDFLALMRSRDNGDTWERVQTDLPRDFPLGQAFYNFCIHISPADPNLLFVGGVEIYRSTNARTSFVRLTFANHPVHVDQHCFATQPGSGTLYVGNDGGVYRSTNNGDEWQNLDATLGNTQFYTIAQHGGQPGQVLGGTQDNGTLRLATAPDRWLPVRGDVDGGAVQSDGSTIFALGTLSIVPFRSFTGGQTWSPMSDGLGPENRRNWLQPLLLHRVAPVRLYTATQFVYQTKDPANQSVPPIWERISPDLTTGATTYESVVSVLATTSSNRSLMYAGTGDGRVQRCRTLLSPAPEWTDVSSGVPRRWVTDIAISGENESTVWITCSGFGTGHVFQTTDAGATWEDVSQGLPDIPVNAIVQSAVAPDVLFVGTDDGVWMSRKGGDWLRFGDGLPRAVVFDVLIDAANRLHAATHGRGVWSTDATLVVDSPPAPSLLAIENVYPQPVIVSLKSNVGIDFSLSLSGRFDIDLYDSRGSWQRSLCSEWGPSGRARRSVNVSGLSPGVYYVRLSSYGSAQVSKMIVLR